MPELKPILHFAPMDGITDFTMRKLITSLGGVDYCTTEFIRVTNMLLPEKIFFENAPELRLNPNKLRSRTDSGTPVFIQLLGSDPVAMSENAHRAAELGAYGIDLNFGCPAKTVNRHDGGAVLLKTPERVFRVVQAVRKAVPDQIPVTAKMRLGYENTDLVFDNARACESGGAKWLSLHCRRKVDMYNPPAQWEWLPRVREILKIPLVANGDINSTDDLLRCQKLSGCQHFMIGRGAMINPLIFSEIQNHFSTTEADKVKVEPEKNQKWDLALKLLQELFSESRHNVSGHYAAAKVKQWLRYQKDHSPEAFELFQRIKTIHDPLEFERVLTGLSAN